MSAAPAKTADPSMEEILASIRRIIADDDDKPPAAEVPQVPPAAPPRDEEEDVLDLSTSDLSLSPEAALEVELPDLSFHAVAPAEEPSEPEPSPIVAPNPMMEQPAPRAPEPERPPLAETPPPPASPPTSVTETIVSHATTASVGQAFNLLSHTIMSQNAHTLEDIVREMLRPMLKTWLDDNLPPMVERLVTAEIQRVARGQR